MDDQVQQLVHFGLELLLRHITKLLQIAGCQPSGMGGDRVHAYSSGEIVQLNELAPTMDKYASG